MEGGRVVIVINGSNLPSQPACSKSERTMLNTLETPLVPGTEQNELKVAFLSSPIWTVHPSIIVFVTFEKYQNSKFKLRLSAIVPIQGISFALANWLRTITSDRIVYNNSSLSPSLELVGVISLEIIKK